MKELNSIEYSSIQIDDKTIGLLSASEIELIRADASISSSPLQEAICQQLLRIEALASASIDGFDSSYRSMLLLEIANENDIVLHDDPASIYRFACKKCPENSLGTVIAYRYMKTVEWVFRNIDKDSLLDRSIFDILRSLYDEERIEALTSNPDVQSAPSRKAIPSIETPPSPLTDFNDESVENYLAFLNSALLTPSAQAEISHALIQLIKPYSGKLDGIERVFSHIAFYRRGVLTSSVAPLAVGPSASVEQHAKTIAANMARFSQKNLAGIAGRLHFEHCAYSTKAAARIMLLCQNALEKMHEKKRPSISGKKESADNLLFDAFFAHPFLTVNAASALIGKSFSATNNAMQSLLEKRLIVEEGRLGKNRVFCMPEIISFFSELQAKLPVPASPERDELLEEYERVFHLATASQHD